MAKIVLRLIFILSITTFYVSCLPPELNFTADDTYIIIWDPEKNLTNHKTLTDSLNRRYPQTIIMSEYMPSTNAVFFETAFSQIPEEALCIFIIISMRPQFHISSEWNLWFPQMWRNLDCRGKILIADGSWGDEFLNSLKTFNPDSIWAIDGKIGQLRRKLPGSLLAAACRFDESNLISRGIDGKTKTALFSWYFMNQLCTEELRKIEILNSLEKSIYLTQTALERGVLTEVEETVFYNKSEVNREEFLKYPNPVVWNGLAEKVFIEAAE